MADTPPQPNQPQTSTSYTLTPPPKDSDLYRFLLDQQVSLKDKCVAFLAKVQKARVPVMEKDKLKTGKTINKKIGETDSWIPISKEVEPLMPLGAAIEVAEYISQQVDLLFSTTYIDPAKSNVAPSALMGLMVGQMLDNPKYKFTGHETDVRAIVLLVCNNVLATKDRSKGAKMLQEMLENTLRQDIRTTHENTTPQSLKSPGTLERTFGTRRG